MKKLIALLLVLSVILFACAKETTVTQTTTTNENTNTVPASTGAAKPTTTTATQTAAAQPNLAALETSGQDCLKEGVKVCLPVNYATAKVGDTLGFAFGLRNQFPDTKKFALKLSFVETRESMGEVAVEEDKDTMKTWLSVNNLESYYEIGHDGTLSKPILVKVKDMVSDSKQTVPGAYVFEVQAQIYENGFYNDFGGPQQFTVRIK